MSWLLGAEKLKDKDLIQLSRWVCKLFIVLLEPDLTKPNYFLIFLIDLIVVFTI